MRRINACNIKYIIIHWARNYAIRGACSLPFGLYNILVGMMFLISCGIDDDSIKVINANNRNSLVSSLSFSIGLLFSKYNYMDASDFGLHPLIYFGLKKSFSSRY